VHLRHARDLEPAAWISDLTFVEATTFGPSGFAAYARLRYIPDPTRPGQSESDVEVSEDHLCDLDQARLALAHLAPHTESAELCYFGLWDGYGDDKLAVGPGARVMLDLPHRRYLLMEGSLDALKVWETDLGRGGLLVPPAFVWPADHAWIFVSDVDPHWAGIGASRAAIENLMGDPVLDVVAADPDLPQPYFS
jgi:hypothetical protein